MTNRELLLFCIFYFHWFSSEFSERNFDKNNFLDGNVCAVVEDFRFFANAKFEGADVVGAEEVGGDEFDVVCSVFCLLRVACNAR